MAHPLFARLDRQLELVRVELANVREAERRFQALRRLDAAGRRGKGLYHEWSHNASLADGVSAVYTGIESVLEAIAKELDEYVPRGDASHADLVDGMAVAVEGVRPALLGPSTAELAHEVRKFRHVVRHKYALNLRRADVAKNLRLAARLVPAFERDYRSFVKRMLEAAPSERRRRR
ncbi:MAG: hypothetical protein A3D95_11080 [Betaproteobacteria bacterium RIFCSPHIGHO2_12_FULL_69_13]|nr:MAG: hypothetical protein A3D95_11080 [Betaproteobacteria bacterium RIFCSPHIGHO2_12_FULL_69_13]OGA68217.1 MAG: hypothetical protein A3G83_01670 [Betaproteobacteria bacterium RIFCSPLOWO2_12_FULL_68_20]